MFTDIKTAFAIIRSARENEEFSISDFRRLLPYLKLRWNLTVLALLFMLLTSLFGLPGPYFLKYVVDDVIAVKNYHALFVIIGLLLFLYVLQIIASLCTSYFFTRLSSEVGVSIKKDLFQRLLRFPLSFFDKNQSGYIVARIGEVGRLELLFSGSTARMFVSIVEFVFSLSMLFYLHWKMTIVSLIFLPLLYVSGRYHWHGMHQSSKHRLEQDARVMEHIQESLSGISVVKTFAKEGFETEKVHNRLLRLLHSSIIQNLIISISGETLGLVNALGGLVILGYGGLEMMHGNLTVGGYLAFTGYMAKLYGPAQMFASLGLVLQSIGAAMHRVFTLFDQVTEDEDGSRTITLSRIRGNIVFQHVDFSYDNQTKVLDKTSFQIKQGQKVAFVGPSGAGKSTILRLILGLYRIQNGSIQIDDHDINRLVLSNLRERIGIVSQNIFLFNDTIMNNILYSNIQATQKSAIEAAKIADAHDFIINLPDGYNTPVGERGVILSGGQMQKVSIARSILKNPDVIIFDEATSHLDSLSERRIQEAMESIFTGKTCIVVAHRLSTIISVDVIFVIDQGRIVEAGSHKELMEKNGKYRELYSNNLL